MGTQWGIRAILGLYEDNGQENANCYIIIAYIHIYIYILGSKSPGRILRPRVSSMEYQVENEMEATSWGFKVWGTSTGESPSKGNG